MAGELEQLWQKHPEYLAVGAIAVGGVILYLYYYYYGKKSTTSSVDASGYYGAQSGAISSGNTLSGLYSTNAAKTKASDAAVAEQNTISGADVAIEQIKSNTSIANVASNNYSDVQLAEIHGDSTDLQNQLLADSANIKAGYDYLTSYDSSADATRLGIAQSADTTRLGIAQSADTTSLGIAKSSDAAAIALGQQNVDLAQGASAERLIAAQDSLAFWRPGAASNITFDPATGQASTSWVQTPASYPDNVIPYAGAPINPGQPYVGPTATAHGTAAV